MTDTFEVGMTEAEEGGRGSFNQGGLGGSFGGFRC